MFLFRIKENSISLIGLKLCVDKIDLTTQVGFNWLRENLMTENVEIFTSEKKFSKDKKYNIFELIEKGAIITKGELFNYFNKMIG